MGFEKFYAIRFRGKRIRVVDIWLEQIENEVFYFKILQTWFIGSQKLLETFYHRKRNFHNKKDSPKILGLLLILHLSEPHFVMLIPEAVNLQFFVPACLPFACYL